jgi:hypothetical protein
VTAHWNVPRVVAEVKAPNVPLSKPSTSGCDAPQPRGVEVRVGVELIVGVRVMVGVADGKLVLVGLGVLVRVAVGGVPVKVGVAVPPKGPAGSGHT